MLPLGNCIAEFSIKIMGSTRQWHDSFKNIERKCCYSRILRLPRWLCNKESSCQCKGGKFDPWVRKIPWRRKWQPSQVFLPGESHGPRSLACRWGHKESDTIEWLNSNTTFLDCCLVLWRGLKSGMNYVDIWWFHSFILFLKREKQNWNYGRRF